jgi:cysteine desulfurase/selenocysteine lyase
MDQQMHAVLARDEYATLRECVYLNQASLGLIPRATTEAMVRLLEDVAQHGNVRLSDEAEAGILDDVRVRGAALLDAPLRAIAIVGGASEGLGQLATMLASSDGEVVLVASDFPSVTYPWLNAAARLGMGIAWVEDRPDADLTASLVDAIGDATTAVCFSAVQFATGTTVDVGAVVGRAREVGARVIVDVTQMAGAAPVSMRDWSADALVCSGYKWLSTHGGVAFLAVGDELLRETPHIVGWKGTEHPFDFQPQSLTLAEDARKFELSTIAYSSAAGLGRSVEMLLGVGIPVIAGHARTLARQLVQAVEPHGWRPFRTLGTAAASDHIVSIRHPTLDPHAVQARLVEQHGIVVGSRGGGLRVSLHAYNDSTDVAALGSALAGLHAP